LTWNIYVWDQNLKLMFQSVKLSSNQCVKLMW
jgi:hypothetical protein